MTYRNARTYIASLERRGWRLGLDRMQEFLRRLGDPQADQGFIHVAGTNGKGSVSTMIMELLTAQGLKVGGFFSPFVYEFRERVQISGQMISEQDLADLTEEILPVSEALADTNLGGPTEFEFKTALGMLHWQRQAVEIVALETGLGGRLDATNVVQPVVSVITEIGMDHEMYLGDSLKEIASEKAGIIKACAPVVCSATDPVARSVIEKRCDEEGVTLSLLGRDFGFEADDDGLKLQTAGSHGVSAEMPMLGDFQRANLATAVAAVELAGRTPTQDHVRVALQNLRLPGRMEVVLNSPVCIFDGAHNEQSIAAVLRSLPAHDRLFTVYSSSTLHDSKRVVDLLAASSTGVNFAPMRHARALDVGFLRDSLAGVDNASEFDSVEAALKSAIEQANPTDAVLVTGSFYLLSEAKESLKSILDLTQSGARQ